MRLIDADDLKGWSEIVQLTEDGGIDINDFEEKLKSMSTVDAVPVIRCKDCKRWESSRTVWNDHVCTWGGYFKEPDDFCSWAERRKDA